MYAHSNCPCGAHMVGTQICGRGTYAVRTYSHTAYQHHSRTYEHVYCNDCMGRLVFFFWLCVHIRETRSCRIALLIHACSGRCRWLASQWGMKAAVLVVELWKLCDVRSLCAFPAVPAARYFLLTPAWVLWCIPLAPVWWQCQHTHIHPQQRNFKNHSCGEYRCFRKSFNGRILKHIEQQQVFSHVTVAQ